MTQLYTTYADLYHKMYQSFIDYDEEYQFYKELLDKHGVKNILEIGCGTGQLAKRFLRDGYVTRDRCQHADAGICAKGIAGTSFSPNGYA